MLSKKPQLDSDSAWLKAVRYRPSPNFDSRPEGIEVSLLVIHAISLPPGKYGGEYIDQLFCNELDCNAHPYFREISDLRVSAHALIDRAGNITQYVPFTARAWHAGVSEFQGRDCCNDFSIGIELEGSDEDPYTDEQYLTLVRLSQSLLEAWPSLSRDRIVGHNDIAPGRKTDPGPHFDWDRFFGALDKGF